MKKSAACEWDLRQKGAGKQYYKALKLSYIRENILIFYEWKAKKYEKLQITTVNITIQQLTLTLTLGPNFHLISVNRQNSNL